MFQTADGLVDACGTAPGLVCEAMFEWTGNELLARGVEWLVAKPLRIAFVLLVAWIVARVLRRWVDRMVASIIEHREERVAARAVDEVDDGRFHDFVERALEKTQFLALQKTRANQRTQALGTVLRSIVTIVVYSLAFMIMLSEFSVNLGPLVAGAGVVGIALGFGAQTLVRDFLSGIFMLAEDQYGVGDVIDVGEASGVVEEINLRTTLLRDVNGVLWFVPNGEIRRVGNKSQQWAKTVLDVEVAYDTDLELASRVIKEVADSVWADRIPNATVLDEPEVLGVERFGESAVAIRVALKVEPGEQFACAREVRRRLKDAFDANGIEIPFPQRTIWVNQVDQDGRSTPS